MTKKDKRVNSNRLSISFLLVGLYNAKRKHKCELSRFITTSSYTKEALKRADDYMMNRVKSKFVKALEKILFVGIALICKNMHLN